MSTHAVYTKVSEHSKNHGRKILRDCMYTDFVKEGRRQQRGDKRVFAKESGFVVLPAPESQTVLFEQVALGATWRSGFDQYPTPDFLERAVPRLLQEELDSTILAITESDGNRRLVTTKAAKEGDTLVVATSLLFSAPSGVTEFLNCGGNGALLEGPMFHVTGVLQHEAAGSRTKSVYAILVGVSRLVADFRGLRKHPNVAFQAHPDAGANDGFLKLVVRTHNGCGIAAGSLVTADFGESFTIAGAGASVAAKRFKGVLDDVFKRQVERNAMNPPCGDPSSDGAGSGAGSRAGGAGGAGRGAGGTGGAGSGAAGAGSGAGGAGGAGSGAGGSGAGGSGAGGAGGSGAGGAGSGAGSAGSGTGGARSGAAGAGSAGGGAGSGAAGAAGTGGTGAVTKQGELLLAQANESAFVIGADGIAVVRSTDGKPHKISPKTVLATIQDGRLEECAEVPANYAFSFQNTKALVIDQATNSVVTLGDLIKSSGAEAVFAYNSFPPGSPPSSLQQKKNMCFVPNKPEEFAKVRKAVGESTKLVLLWVVRTQNKKVGPKALAVVNLKQVIVKATGEEKS